MKKLIEKRRFLIILIISVLILPPGYLFIKSTLNYLSDYLSKSEQVKANILVIEGWIPDYALEFSAKEFQKNGYDHIITTGLKSFSNYYKVSSNGYLIFYTKNRFSENSEVGEHSIEIDAHSEMGGDNRAHFNLFINDSLTGDFYVKKVKAKYRIRWQGSLNKIDSVMVQFNNDNWGDFGDRNLYIKDISIDDKYNIPYLNNSVYDMIELDGKQRIVNNYNSYAEFAKNRLVSLGIDSSLITAVPGKKTRINRTLTSALAFRDWLKATDIEIEGINILTMGTHSRRTWMAFNQITDDKYQVGIISIPDRIGSYSRKNRALATIRETLGIIYYWIILIPY